MKTEKKLLLSLFFFVGVVLTGTFHILYQSQRNRHIKKNYDKNKILLKQYMINIKKAPNDKGIDILNREKEFLLKRKKTIFENFVFQKVSEDPFPKIRTALEFRALLTKKRRQLAMKDIGFSEYKNKIPSLSELNQLKKEFYLIEKVIHLSDQCHIKQWDHIIRLGLKKEKKPLLFQKHTVLFMFQCFSKDLFSLLYAIVSLKDPIVIEGFRVESLGQALFVVFKLSLFERTL